MQLLLCYVATYYAILSQCFLLSSPCLTWFLSTELVLYLTLASQGALCKTDSCSVTQCRIQKVLTSQSFHSQSPCLKQGTLYYFTSLCTYCPLPGFELSLYINSSLPSYGSFQLDDDSLKLLECVWKHTINSDKTSVAATLEMMSSIGWPYS